MSVTIYHNPSCSKSRKTLELIRESGIIPTIVEYLHTPPDGQRIIQLAALLGTRPEALLRRHEAEFVEATDLPGLDDDKALADWIARHPKTLQRPIVVVENPDRAAIGRPPEDVLAILPR